MLDQAAFELRRMHDVLDRYRRVWQKVRAKRKRRELLVAVRAGAETASEVAWALGCTDRHARNLLAAAAKDGDLACAGKSPKMYSIRTKRYYEEQR